MIREFFRKDFFTKKSTGMTFARMAIFLPLSLVVMFLSIDFYFDLQAKHRREFFAEVKQEQAEIKSEAQRRYSALQSTDRSDTAELAFQTADPQSTEPPAESPSTEFVENVEVMTSGPLKGMTVESAKAFANQTLADSKAAATKRHEWELRRKEVRQRRSKNADQRINLALASTKRGDDERAMMLSVFKLMSEDQREQVRQELLETEPADKVNAFFDKVANAPTKTDEQLQKDAKDILKSREAYRAARRELQIEREQIQLELEELERIKPF